MPVTRWCGVWAGARNLTTRSLLHTGVMMMVLVRYSAGGEVCANTPRRHAGTARGACDPVVAKGVCVCVRRDGWDNSKMPACKDPKFIASGGEPRERLLAFV